MPLYEYECESGHRFERIQKFSDPPVDKCPVCGNPVHRLISPPAIQFKGSGWYVTDYARKSEKSESTGKSDSGTSTPDNTSKTAEPASPAKESTKETAKESKESPKPAAEKATPGSKT